MNNYKLSLNNYSKVSWQISPHLQRPQSEISLVAVTSREFDLKERLGHYDRKLAQQHMNDLDRKKA